jgi:NADH dehydrogenase FAD-containing subunit
MSAKRIIILGGGFGGMKCAETLRDVLPRKPDPRFAPARV